MTEPDTMGRTADPMSGTGQGLIAFLTLVEDRNEMVPATAQALRTGCKKVLEVDEDLNADMRNIDEDELLRRFRIRNRAALKDRSLDNYDQRFRQSVIMYRKWLNDDKDWLQIRRSVPKGTRKPNGVKASSDVAVSEAPTPADTVQIVGARAGMITYPLPIRPGVKGTLILPEDLTRREAERVAQFVAALAFDERLAITSGGEYAEIVEG